jgi:hypothetical protein
MHVMNIKESPRNIREEAEGRRENYSRQSISLNIFMFSSSLSLFLSYLVLLQPVITYSFFS